MSEFNKVINPIDVGRCLGNEGEETIILFLLVAELMKTFEHLMHVPIKAVYLTLTLIEIMASMVTVNQGEKDGLTTYLKKFKTKKNLMTNLFGHLLLDGYVKIMIATRGSLVQMMI